VGLGFEDDSSFLFLGGLLGAGGFSSLTIFSKGLKIKDQKRDSKEKKKKIKKQMTST